MAQDLMLSRMVEYALFNDVRNTHETLIFFKENGMWGKQKGRMRSVCWYNAMRLVDAFKCGYINENDNGFIPNDDKHDFVKRVREWEIKEIPPKKMWRMAWKLRYEQPWLKYPEI